MKSLLKITIISALIFLVCKTEIMVKFKGYSFFMPLYPKGKNVIIEVKAFLQETFLANGVLLR